MAGETILIIDANEATEQKIMTILEAKGYLVFTVSSQALNAETLEKLGPSLIYVAPREPGAAGIEACKAVHGNPSLKKVPIVLLESSETARGLQDLKGYGVVGFLQPTFDEGELIKETETILGSPSPSPLHGGNGWVAQKSAEGPRPPARTHGAGDDLQVNEWESIDRVLSEKHKKTTLGEPWEDGVEDPGEKLGDEPPWAQTEEETGKKRALILRLLIGAALFVGLAGAGLLAYQQFAPARKVWPVRPVASPAPASPKFGDVQPDVQAAPEKQAAAAPGLASQGPDSQAPAPVEPAPAAAVSSRPTLSVPSVPASSAELSKTPSLPEEPASQHPAKPFYSVQIGAYKIEANAQDLAKEFQEKGYDAFIQRGVAKDKSPVYRVLVSKSEDRRAVKKLADEIRLKEKIETVLYGD